MAEEFDVIVGGTGMGGLTAGALLAARGFRTLILERQPRIGGYMSGFRRGPYRFDSAANFLGALGEGEELARLLEEIGLRDRIEFAPVGGNLRVILPDRRLETRRQPYEEALRAAFPKLRDQIERFSRLVGAIGDDVRRFAQLSGWKRLLTPLLCRHLFRHARSRLGDWIDRQVADPSLRALLSFLPATAPPSELSLLFAATVLAKGGPAGLCYPVGGFGHFAEMIAEAAAEHGTQLRTGEGVAAVEHDGRRVCAVRTTSSRRLRTRAFVADFNPDDLLKMLDGPETRRIRVARRRTAGFRYAASAFIVYLGLKDSARGSNEFFLTTIFETTDLENLYRAIGQGEIPEQSVIYVTFPCACGAAAEREAAPIAKLITPVPYGPFARWRRELGEEGYQQRKREMAERLVERVSRHIPSLRGAIAFCDAATPLTLERWTGNRGGAMYGLEPTPDQFGPARWPNAGVLRGLYFCGHYSRPSHGVVGTCYSGRFVAERATRQLAR